MFDGVEGHAGSVITDADGEKRLEIDQAIFEDDVDLDGVGAGVEGIFEEVDEDAAQGEGIGTADQAASIAVFVEGDLAVPGFEAEVVPGFMEQSADVTVAGLNLDGLGVLAHVFVKAVQVVLGALDAFEEFEGARLVLKLQAEELDGGLAALEGVSAFVDQAGHGFADGGQAFVEQDAFGGSFTFADIADDGGEELAMTELDHADGQFEGDARAIASQADDFAPGGGEGDLAGGALLDQLEVSGAVGFGHEDRDFLADELAGAVTEESQGREVEGFDAAKVVEGDDAVDRFLEDGFEAGLAFAESFFNFFLAGDDDVGGDDSTFGLLQGRGLELEPTSLRGRVAGVFQQELGLITGEDGLEPGECGDGGFRTLIGGMAADVQVADTEADLAGGRAIAGGEGGPGFIDGDDQARAIEDGDVGAQGIEHDAGREFLAGS